MSVRRQTEVPAGFRPVPRTGVIYVMTEAVRLGYSPSNPKWVNLGQGAPETGALPGAPERLVNIPVESRDLEYAPIDGLPELRKAVADYYNSTYRLGRESQYSAENVAICSGGRLAMTRLVSTIGRTNVGHFLPDYTAYEELLDAFGTFSPSPIALDPDSNYVFSSAELKREVLGRGLSAVLLSNPCNPTGTLIEGEELSRWVSVGREVGCTLIFDEFYSHYIYDLPQSSISAAEFVEDVNSDPVVIIDGLTKNWRYPGLRLSWTLAPKKIIDSLASAGSFLDGGAARPIQRAALGLVTTKVAEQESAAIRSAFSEKRTRLMSGLKELGVKVSPTPRGGFYCWGDLSALPQSINTGMKFFQKALEHNVIVVPGEFFDINPGQRRPDRPSRFQHFVRFSFGPPMASIELGLKNLSELVRQSKS